jgi:hypothetical protein
MEDSLIITINVAVLIASVVSSTFLLIDHIYSETTNRCIRFIITTLFSIVCAYGSITQLVCNPADDKTQLTCKYIGCISGVALCVLSLGAALVDIGCGNNMNMYVSVV